MATRDTIVVGASAGGVQALIRLIADLPADLPAALFIVLHVSPNIPSLLPGILARDSSLRVAHAIDGEAIRHGIAAVRALEEQTVLARRIVERARNAKREQSAKMFERRAREAEEHSSVIRQVLLTAE